MRRSQHQQLLKARGLDAVERGAGGPDFVLTATTVVASAQARRAARDAQTPRSGLAAYLNRRVRLTPTGHTFTVLGFNTTGTQVEVLDGRLKRWLPADLLRQAQVAGLLEDAG